MIKVLEMGIPFCKFREVSQIVPLLRHKLGIPLQNICYKC